MEGVRTVYICEDHPLFRQSLEVVVKNSTAFEFAGSAGSGTEAVEMIQQVSPDIILLDLNLPGKDGFEVLGFVRAHLPSSLVVILTSYNDKLLAEKARKNGAAAYLLKDTEEQELLNYLCTLKSGSFQTNVGDGSTHLFEKDEQFTSILKLTRTERKLVNALVEGQSVSELADKFHISENTVKNHKKNIYRKLEVKTQAELILLCQKHGLLE